MNTLVAVLILGALVSVVTTIILMVMVVPAKKYQNLSGFGKFLHNVFNFKSLMIEKILRGLYVLSTTACVICGFFMLFGFGEGIFGDTMWYGGYGLLIMLLGPIALRLVFESLMMFILLVKNTIQINTKLSQKDENKDNNNFDF